MPVLALVSLVAATPVLAAVLPTFYVVALIAGGGLLVFSTLLGGDGHSADAHVGGLDAHASDFHAQTGDLHHGPDGEAGQGHGISLGSWFSVRFVVYFLATFGLIGTVLTKASDTSSTVTLVAALAGGLVIGQLAHQLIRHLALTSVTGITTTRDYVDKSARVTMAIRPPHRGEVAIRIGDSERFVPALSRRDQDAFDAGQSVVVLEFRSGTALVVSQQEYDFLKQA